MMWRVLACSGLTALLGGAACGPRSPTGQATGGGSSSTSTTSDISSGSASATTEPPRDDLGVAPEPWNPACPLEPHDWPPNEGDQGCNQWLQDCPDGQKCAAYAADGGGAFNAVHCVPVGPDARAPGEPCTVEGAWNSGVDDCELGSMCWDPDPATGLGTCRQLCAGTRTDPCCSDPCGSRCLVLGDDWVAVCLPVCDPIAQDCGEGQQCLLVPGDGYRCSYEPDENLPAGAPCTTIAECDAGLTCVEAERLPACDTAACCTPYCLVDNPTACDAVPGSICETLAEQPAPGCPGWGTVGLCVAPP